MAEKKGAVPKTGDTQRSSSKGAIPKSRREAPFLKSGMTARTPPQARANEANESIYLCQICQVEDGIEKIQCDKCTLWYHFTCARINSDVLKLDVYLCSNCTKPPEEIKLIDIENDPSINNSIVLQQVDQVAAKPPSVEHKSTASRKSNSNSSTIRRRTALALQKLEEERQLLEQREREAEEREREAEERQRERKKEAAERQNERKKEAADRQRKRDEEYLRQKYSLLEDDAMSNPSFDDQEEPQQQQRFEEIERWAKEVNTRNNEPLDVIDNNDLYLEPHLDSTHNQQPAKEIIEPNSNMELNRAISTAERIESHVRQAHHEAPQIDLPDWLTHPALAEPTLPTPWLRPNLRRKSNEVPSSEVSEDILQQNNENVRNDVSQPQPYETNQFPTTVSSASDTDFEIERAAKVQKELATVYRRIQAENNLMRPYHQPPTTMISQKSIEPPVDHHQNRCSTSSNILTDPSYQLHTGEAHEKIVRANQQSNGAVNCQSVGTHSTMGNAPQTNCQTQSLCNNQPQRQQKISSRVQSHNTAQPRSAGTNQANSNGQQNHERRVLDIHQSNQLFGHYQPHYLSNAPNNTQTISPPQNSDANQNQWSSPPQNSGANQNQWISLPQNSGANQNQWIRQPQSSGANQQQWISQPQSLGPIQQRHWQTDQFVNTPQPLRLNNPIASTNVAYSVSISSPLSSTIQKSSSMGYDNHTPITQPNIMSSSTNAIYGMNRSVAPGRLTSEQIASRHVMPKDLPQFDGDPRQWYKFISAYDNSNEACGFSNSENLGRLQKCLKGEAEEAVRSQLFHKDSVPGIIETLKMLFGRPELIIEALIGDVEKLPTPKHDDLPALIKFAIAIRNLSETIQHCGASEHLRNPMLINSIVDKLPTMHRMNWAIHKTTMAEPNISHLGDWLYRMASVFSQVVRVSNKPAKNQEQHKNNNKSNSNSPKSNPFLNLQVENTSANNKSNADQSKDSTSQSCPACNNQKCTKLNNCTKFKELAVAERWTLIKKHKVCGRCLGNHNFRLCKLNQSCSVNGCNGFHHKLLHKYASTDKAETQSNICNSQNSKSAQRTDKFRIVPVMLHHKNKSIREYAYLDDGSNMTTMENSLADELGLTGTSTKLCVDWAFGQTHSVTDSKIISVKISGYYDNAPRFTMANVRTVKHLHLPTQSITTNWLDQYQHLKTIPIVTYDAAKPRLLIGLQYSKLITSLETIEGKDDEPIVCKTRLGWVVQGPTYTTDEATNANKFSINMCVCQNTDNDLHQLVKNYFSMEHLGIKIPENNLESIELQRAKQILDSTTVKKGDRYETGLLWKHDDVELPDSYKMALKRLICLEKKMEKDPGLKAKLCNQITQFVEKGYIRKLSKQEIKDCKHRVWYLPTFPVFNPKKPEKVRLVWDGAAKVNNTSLNAELLVGPDELVPLPELLRRFRERKIGVTGDIEEMYHQIQIKESDQHVQRFLWREDPTREPDVYVMMVMTFGSKCSPSSAQYVKNKNAKQYEKECPRAVESIVLNHYVDDMIDSADSIDEAATLVKDVKMIHRSGGFNIRNFTSNSRELLKAIGENIVPHSKDLNIGGEIGTERVLGMFWDTATDCFTYSLKFTKFNASMLSGMYHPTKREALRLLMSVFDPLGLLANFLVHGKIMLQEIWKSKTDWDEKISSTTYMKWGQWLKELPTVEELKIPRWYSTKLSPGRKTTIQLHTFVDAGEEACCAMTFLRIEDEEGVDCCLVSAKTKVAPTKPMTVPRLELQAAVMGTRLARNVMNSQRFTFDKEVYWTDSQTVVAWLNSETRRYNQFVSFRIGEILEETDASQWNWVPTRHNVADEGTKSKNKPKLAANSRWLKAPAFLYGDWVKKEQNFTTEEELRPCFVMSMRELQSQQLIDLNRFSQWNRLLRVQAYVLRFIHNLQCGKRNRQIGNLSQRELIQAENCLYQRAQRDVFMDEILIVKYNEKRPVKEYKSFENSSELRRFSPYLDENNVLRHKGRIDAADSINYETKRPIILPRRHQITNLLVDRYHRIYKHLNHQTALNEIRQKFLIPALRVVMKGIRSSCQRCKNENATTKVPEMAGLPPTRLATFTRPFTFTGVDYFGPFAVKVNRSVVPRYGVIFTCLTTRAVHLEVADSLNTSSCINAVRRFSARKGKSRRFHSDNGTNFHGANNALKKEFEKLDRDQIQQEFTSSEQEWTFNPPSASHMGGVWERLIRTVKNCLKQMLTTKTPTQEMLTTLLAEVENIINSRPLTHISLDTADDEALTPNHFLFGTSNALTPIADTTQMDLNRNDWRAIQEMTKHFWHRFVLEYLPELTTRTKWWKQVEPIKVGDIVLVIDERNPRNKWPKAMVEEVIMAKDGCIRQAMVRLGKRLLMRPVSKLAILDVKLPNEKGNVELHPTESLNGGKNVAQRSNAVTTDSNQKNSARVLPEELSTKPTETQRNPRYSLRNKRSC